VNNAVSKLFVTVNVLGTFAYSNLACSIFSIEFLGSATAKST
jgi:hypothetical protein